MLPDWLALLAALLALSLPFEFHPPTITLTKWSLQQNSDCNHVQQYKGIQQVSSCEWLPVCTIQESLPQSDVQTGTSPHPDSNSCPWNAPCWTRNLPCQTQSPHTVASGSPRVWFKSAHVLSFCPKRICGCGGHCYEALHAQHDDQEGWTSVGYDRGEYIIACRLYVKDI